VVGKKREGLLRFALKNKKANILFHKSQTGPQKFPSTTLILVGLDPQAGLLAGIGPLSWFQPQKPIPTLE